MATLTKDNLWAGDYPRRYRTVTIAQNQSIVVGSVIGIVTSSGEAVLLDAASADGSENFFGIALEEIETGAAETQTTVVAVSGDFQSQGLTLGGATTVADIIDDARALNCYIHTTYEDENIVGGY